MFDFNASQACHRLLLIREFEEAMAARVCDIRGIARQESEEIRLKTRDILDACFTDAIQKVAWMEEGFSRRTRASLYIRPAVVGTAAAGAATFIGGPFTGFVVGLQSVLGVKRYASSKQAYEITRGELRNFCIPDPNYRKRLMSRTYLWINSLASGALE